MEYLQYSIPLLAYLYRRVRTFGFNELRPLKEKTPQNAGFLMTLYFKFYHNTNQYIIISSFSLNAIPLEYPCFTIEGI